MFRTCLFAARLAERSHKLLGREWFDHLVSLLLADDNAIGCRLARRDQVFIKGCIDFAQLFLYILMARIMRSGLDLFDSALRSLWPLSAFLYSFLFAHLLYLLFSLILHLPEGREAMGNDSRWMMQLRPGRAHRGLCAHQWIEQL